MAFQPITFSNLGTDLTIVPPAIAPYLTLQRHSLLAQDQALHSHKPEAFVKSIVFALYRHLDQPSSQRLCLRSHTSFSPEPQMSYTYNSLTSTIGTIDEVKVSIICAYVVGPYLESFLQPFLPHGFYPYKNLCLLWWYSLNM